VDIRSEFGRNPVEVDSKSDEWSDSRMKTEQHLNNGLAYD